MEIDYLEEVLSHNELSNLSKEKEVKKRNEKNVVSQTSSVHSSPVKRKKSVSDLKEESKESRSNEIRIVRLRIKKESFKDLSLILLLEKGGDFTSVQDYMKEIIERHIESKIHLLEEKFNKKKS